MDEHRQLLGVLAAGLLIGLAARFVVLTEEGDPGRPPPAEALDVTVLEADPASGLPLVPVDETMLFFAGEHRPDDLLAPGARFASDHPIRPTAPNDHRVDLLASFPDDPSAMEAGRALDAAAGDEAAEAGWLRAHGVEDPSGFGWVGPDRASLPFVQVFDRHVLISDLTYDEALDDGAGSLDRSGYRTPLIRALEADGAMVLVEGDRGGEGAITMDLTCAGSAEDIAPLVQDAADLQQQPVAGLQPPWLGDGISAAERAARRTHRLLATAQAGAFQQILETDPEARRLMRDLQAVAEGGGARARRTIADLQQRLAEAVADQAAPDLGRFASVLDAEVVAWTVADRLALTAAMAEAVDPSSPAAVAEGRREAVEAESEHRREVLGASEWGLARDGTFTGGVGVDGGDLAFTFATWTGLAVGFGPLLEWLHEGGCADIRVAFFDFDAVRGD